jgi:hypothetical protein
MNLDLDFTPRKPVKCKHCGKDAGQHHANTKGCPIGARTRIGHIFFSKETVFEPKPERKRKNERR